MKYLLIHDLYASEIIEALEIALAQFRVEEEKRCEEMRNSGWIICYSNLERMFTDPINTVRLAERVSFNGGILGPPTGDEKWFLIPERYQRDLSGQLAHRGFTALSEVIQSAKLVTIPEVHSFINPDGFEYEVTGWDQEDALKRLEAQSWLTGPFEWSGSWPAFPGHVINRGRQPRSDYHDPIEESAEVDISELQPAVAADLSGDDIPF